MAMPGAAPDAGAGAVAVLGGVLGITEQKQVETRAVFLVFVRFSPHRC